METNNTITLTREQLTRSLDSIFSEVMSRPGRMGLPRVSYTDEFDIFEMRLERTTRGYSVSCRLNNSQSYQLNTRFFDWSLPIGIPMMVAANATWPAGRYAEDVVREFFA